MFNSRLNIRTRTVGRTRTVRKFLLLPRTFKSKNTRWLEYADIVERLTQHLSKKGYLYIWWREVGFADEPDSIYPPSL